MKGFGRRQRSCRSDPRRSEGRRPKPFTEADLLPWATGRRSGMAMRSTGHVLKLREVERLLPFETALGEHLKRRIDALRVIQAADGDEDHSWEALQVAAEHPGAALRAEASI